MRAWRQRPLFQVRPGEVALDAALEARGYRLHEPSVLYVAPSEALAAPVGLAAIPCDAPLACMAEIWAAEDVGPARLAVMGRASDPRTWLLGRLDERPMGCAFVAVAGGIAMLSALVVAPEARRHGLAARMVQGAAAWAAAKRAATFGLAVTRANAPARALYARLGMAEAARYHYRIAPEETP